MPRFVFISGAAGSGTTYLLRVLSAPDSCISLGGNYEKFPSGRGIEGVAKRLSASTKALWDREAPSVAMPDLRTDWRKTVRRSLRSPHLESFSHILFKRSSPFLLPLDRYRPNLFDVATALPNCALVVIYRDPCPAAYSTMRRFGDDLHTIVAICAGNLAWLADQVEQLGARVCLISYERLCEDPRGTMATIARETGIPAAALDESIAAAPPDRDANRRWRQELAAEEVDWLENYFTVEKRTAWAALSRPDAA